MKWYRLAADQGHANAMYMVGKAYDVSYWGVQQDFTEAAKWFLLAAEQGHARAQFKIAVMYSFGQGVPSDQTESNKWFRLAAEQGTASDQMLMAFTHRYVGLHGQPDVVEAARWYRMAANQGDASAQYELGTMYNKGEGVTQGYLLAYMWISLAADKGKKGGSEKRDSVAAKMTPSDISKARQMAQECKASDYKFCGN